MRLGGRGLFLALLVATTASSWAETPADRRAAINRALNFVHTIVLDDHNLARFGSDILWCFYSISRTSSDPGLRQSAASFGHETAERWRKIHQHVPPEATAPQVYLLVLGAYSADLLGWPDPGFKEELRNAAGKFTARDFLGFDAEHEPPRMDDPNRYDVYSSALITTYFGDAYGIRLGATHSDVTKWLPQLRPYKPRDESMAFDIFFAITHVIYTTNDYNEYRVAPAAFSQEIQFLRQKLKRAMAEDDPEIVGEALDCLRAAGYERDPQVLKGMKYLVSTQRTDGTWAGDSDDPYTEYHSAWTSIDALRDYNYQGEASKLP